MSGVLVPPTGGTELPEDPVRHDDLFSNLIVSNPPSKRRYYGLPLSISVHVAVFALIVVVPIVWPTPLPEQVDYIKLLIYNPPPPPPPRPPLGNTTTVPRKDAPPKHVSPLPEQEAPKFTVDIPKETPDIRPEGGVLDDQFGSPTGSLEGVPGGMEDFGVDGGVLGGVPGGVLGGVIGGTGDGRPVLDPDQQPRPIKMPKPVYPQEAFVKKIEGTVVLEILIDQTGRVMPTRVLQSIPALDKAAIECVRQWMFSPATKHGRPVSTIAHAPVVFRIY